jgi:hypothetical protein
VQPIARELDEVVSSVRTLARAHGRLAALTIAAPAALDGIDLAADLTARLRACGHDGVAVRTRPSPRGLRVASLEFER